MGDFHMFREKNPAKSKYFPSENAVELRQKCALRLAI